MDGESDFIAHLFFTLLGLVALFLLTFDALPNACNTLRYGEIRRESAAWLTQKLGEETFSKIKEMPYNNVGFFKVKKLLDNLQIANAITPIPDKFKKLDDTPPKIRRSNSW